MNIKAIIDVNKLACENVEGLESAVSSCEIKNDKDKANFGNLCIALRGFRMVADATEALLINENVLKGKDGNFYQKIEEEQVIAQPAPKTEGEGHSQNEAKE